MKQATDYAQVLVSCSKCDTTCMHGWRGSVQGKDQQQTLKPQMKLRGSIGDAHKICEDAGKLSLPQATREAVRMLLYVTTPSNSCATNCKLLSHMNKIPDTECLLIQSVCNIPASKYAYIKCCKPTALLLYQLLL